MEIETQNSSWKLRFEKWEGKRIAARGAFQVFWGARFFLKVRIIESFERWRDS
jgi:hypothetical protein